VEGLLAFASTGSAAAPPGSSGTLIQARRILRATTAPRWSSIIAAVAGSR
jgi:hypothetical protein